MTNARIPPIPRLLIGARASLTRDDASDPAMLAFLRIALGGVLSWELWRYLDLDFPRDYAETPIHFTFWPFDWVHPLPTAGMTYLFVGLSLAAALVAVGAFFRSACLVLGVGMTYIFLLDRAFYLNHWYLACILTFLLALTPANAIWSVDGRSRPSRFREGVPPWTIRIVRFQVAVVYLFAGLCKLNPDWLAGRPMRIWLGDATGFPVLGGVFQHSGAAQTMAILALVFDLSMVPLMMSPRTRRFIYPIALVFHLMNSRLFTIGMFPWLMMLLTAVFFPSDFPRRLLDDLRHRRRRLPTLLGGSIMAGLCAWIPGSLSPPAMIVGFVAGSIAGYHLFGGDVAAPSVAADGADSGDAALRPSRLVKGFLVAWMVVQVALPIRPYLYPGNTAWTEEGQQFSWRLLVRTKSGRAIFHVRDPLTGQVTDVYPETYLSGARLDNLATQPDMLVQFANFLERRMRPSHQGHDLEVRVSTAVKLNGHKPLALVDPNVDLTRVSRPWFPPAPWITPGPG